MNVRDNIKEALEKFATMHKGSDAEVAVSGMLDHHGPLYLRYLERKMRRDGLNEMSSPGDILQWIIDHQDQLLALAKFIITIIGMFS